MTISDPPHWKDAFKNYGFKYDKIVAMITDINLNSTDRHADPHPHAPQDHKTSHENGGGDEISVLGLSGLLADLQNAIAHKVSHQDGGGDEISVAALSGLLADAQNWLASTVSQAEAEAGTATIDRKWTAERVKQAIEVLGFPAPTSPYTQEISANTSWGYVGSQSTTQQVTVWGVSHAATGTNYTYFEIIPPDWLLRYCEINSLILTLTQLTVRWQNDHTDAYLTEYKYHWMDGDTHINIELYTSITNLGQGSTGFRNDVFNGTDHTFTRGDCFHLRLDSVQPTGDDIFIKSISAVWTFS